MNETYQDEIEKEVKRMSDELYSKTREAITPNKQRLPYREYVRERSLFWIAQLADDSDLVLAKEAIAKRTTTS